jgi:glycosyltransferase involved in cell wall biosynthesis
MEPLVSVVVPFYNQEAFVDDAISSVVAQDHPRIQLIVADDASADGTLAALRRHEDAPLEEVRILHNERNRGVSGNMNVALAEVRGEFVALMAGDDTMLPGKLRAQVSLLRRTPEAVAAVHDAEVFDSDSGDTLGWFSELYNGAAGVRDGGVELLFDPSYLMLPSTTMFRTSAMPECGFDERLVFANDLLWFIELVRAGQIVGSPERLVRYRRHAGNLTGDPNTRARILEEGLITMAIVAARHPELEPLSRRRAAAFLLAESRRRFATADRQNALRYARAAIAQGGVVGATSQAVRLARRSRRTGQP